MQVTFHALDVGTPETVTGIRLVQRSEQPYLLLARRTQLSEAPLPPPDATGRLVFTDAGVLGGTPAWDAKPVQGRPGDYATLYVRSESAVAWAMFQTPNPPIDMRLHLEPFAVYDHPRFAKGQQPDQWSVTAVSYQEGASIPVVFPRDGIGPDDPPSVAIGRRSQTIEDARLLRVGNHFWLLVLERDPSVANSTHLRELPSGRRTPAVLSAVHLNAALAPTAPAVKVFGSTPIYEFDVDAVADGSAVVFATTSEGVLFARGALTPAQALSSSAWKITELEAPLVSPSVLVSGAWAHVAAVANLGSPQASVVYGAVQL